LVPPKVVFRILVLVLIGLAVFVAVLAGGASRDAADLGWDGAVVQAVVTDRLSKRVRNNRRAYEVTLAFTTDDGEMVTVTERVSEEDFQKLEIGAATDIRYAVSKPRLVEMKPGAAWRSALLAWAVAAVFAFGAGFALWLGRVVARQQRLV